ncbi:MAG: AraC family transcriptional regulator [Bacteroidetes bacterium]|nr:AraC family transcriptional regulator [Bacteroidota bacterium]MCL2303569.1 AraC family transcriptional regulator [Lentimicrobiaceae bacterium]
MNVPNEEIQVHLNCFNYGKSKEVPLIEIKNYESGSVHQITNKSNMIVIVLSGVICFSFGKTYNKQATKGSIIMHPAKYASKIEIKEDVTLVIFHLDVSLNFCDHFSFEMLYKEKKEKKNEGTYILNANNVIKNYLTLLTTVLNDGLYCNYLLEIKLKEFLFLLRFYYPMEELKAFFAQILTDDLEFSEFIRKHSSSDMLISDLAKKMHYSTSGFEKRFKKVFDMSPSQWMQSQKAQAIYHEINCSTKTFAELGYEFGFSSPSHFNSFCKKHFNNSPGNIRKKNKM